MGEYLQSALRIIVSAAGAAVAGPVGSLLGGMVGGLIGGAAPGLASFVESAAGELTNDSLDRLGERVINRFSPPEIEDISDQLQTAFRDALQESFYDLGGIVCFPSIWKTQPRSVPDNVPFFKSHAGKRIWMSQKPLAEQVVDCIRSLSESETIEKFLSEVKPSVKNIAEARTYLDVDKPVELNRIFFDELIRPALSSYRTLLAEVPELETHLHNHLLDRAILHLGRLVKERSEAWRSFNQLVLSELQTTVKQISQNQTDLIGRIKTLSEGENLAIWSDQVADLLIAASQLDKKVDEGFSSLTTRLQTQHAEVIDHLESSLAIDRRIESKVDRVLKILEDGRWIVEGTPPIATNEPPAPGEAPFMGLQFFDVDDSSRFFGRELLTARLVNRLHKESFLAVVGASGSGKSSVVRAGLVPALRRGEPLADGSLPPRGSNAWPVFVITPGSHPLESLAAALTREDSSILSMTEMEKSLAAETNTLHLAARKLIEWEGHASRLVLVIDQFEELFTLCRSEDERKAFLENLLYAADEDTGGNAVIVLTIRADFYDHCGQYESLRQILTNHQEYIGPMNRAELQRAICEPLRQGGWSLEPGLIDLILYDAGDEPGALPLLSHALLETWKHRRGRTLTLESYAESGGVRGAIARTAEAVFYKQFDDNEQKIARGIFLRLTEPGEGTQDTRRRATLLELIPSADKAEQVKTVLSALADARLVTTTEGSIEVAHEALIREWPTLRRWLDDSREGLRIQRRLAEATQEWRRLNRDEGLLYRGVRLSEALEWSSANSSDINPQEREFLLESQAVIQREAAEREAQHQRETEKSMQLAEVLRLRLEEQASSALHLRKRAMLLSVALLVAGVFAVAALFLAQRAETNAHQARNNSATAQVASTLAVSQQRTAESARQAAMDQQATAQAESRRAEQAAGHSRAGALAALSINSLVKNPQRSLLLGIEAQRLADASGGQRVPLAEEALWQAASGMGGHPLIPGAGGIHSSAYSPDGKWLAAGSESGVVYLIDRKSSTNSPRQLKGHTERVTGIAFSKDLRWFVTGSWDKTIQIYSLSNLWAVPVILQVGHEGVNELAISPDGNWLAAAAWDGTLIIWNFETLASSPVEISAAEDILETVVFSPDSRQLAAAGRDGKIRIWSMDSLRGNPVQISASESSINSLAYSPNGKWLAAGGDDKSIIFYLAQNLELPPVVKSFHTSWVLSLAFSPDSNILASSSGDQLVALWNANDLDQDPVALRGHESWVITLAFSPEGNELASGDWGDGVRIWNVNQPFSLPVKINNIGLGLAVSPSGHWLAASDIESVIHIIDLTSIPPKDTAGLSGHRLTISASAFSPDEHWLASASYDQTVRLWDLENIKKSPRVLTGFSGAVSSLAFSPDGKYLATSSWDQTVKLWSMENLSTFPRTGQQSAEVMAVAFAPDGSRLVTGSSSGELSFWDPSGDLHQPQLKIEMEKGIFSLAYQPDGKLLAVGTNDGRLWFYDPADLSRSPQVHFGHTDTINTIAYSHDGRWLASGSNDQTILIWDLVETFLEPVTLRGHTGWVQNLAFSPDDLWLYSADWDFQTRAWIRKTSALVESACLIAGRNFTLAEWSQYFPGEDYHQTCGEWMSAAQ